MTWIRNLGDETYLVGLSHREQGTLCFIQVRGDVPAYYDLRYQERFERRTTSQALIGRAKELIVKLTENKNNPPQWRLIADITAGGRPFLDELRRADLSPHGVSVISGYEETIVNARQYRTPLRDIASTMKALLGGHRLKISSGVPRADQLVRFMSTLDVTDKITMDAEGDAILAPGVALWFGERWTRAFPKKKRGKGPVRTKRLLGALR